MKLTLHDLKQSSIKTDSDHFNVYWADAIEGARARLGSTTALMDHLGVSRAAVCSWLTGKCTPQRAIQPLLLRLLEYEPPRTHGIPHGPPKQLYLSERVATQTPWLANLLSLQEYLGGPAEMARHLGCTRQSVYVWMNVRQVPSPQWQDRVESLLSQLTE